MKFPSRPATAFVALSLLPALIAPRASAQIGTRFPSEKKIVPDPVTGVPLEFLTSTPKGDSKIYQTHHQWTSDGKWIIFRSNRVRGQAMAVNEETGVIVQVTEGGYSGMLCLADHSMNLYFARTPGMVTANVSGAPAYGGAMTPANGERPRASEAGGNAGVERERATHAAGATASGAAPERPRVPSEIVRVDLAKLFADSEAGHMQAASEYEHVCGTVPLEYGVIGDVALDPTEDYVYFHYGSKEEAAKHLPPDTKVEAAYGPRHMGAGPNGLASMNLHNGEVKPIVAVPFQIGHVQTNPWVPGEIVFCWETGGKAPQRTWTVRSDGSGLRPLYPEAPYDWVTHEAVITPDEVALAILGHRKVGVNDEWGIAGTREHPTGLAIVNLRTHEMRIAGQTKSGSGLWHVNGSADGRWAVGDDFSRTIYLIDRHTDEMMVLSTGHKETAADHPHPTFNAAGTKIEIQSAMLSENNRSMNICVIPVPEAWLKRTYAR